MIIVGADEVLEQTGFYSPHLRALIPNEDNYSALLLQPHGELEADTRGVRHRDSARAVKQFAAFLSKAKHDNADLAITPEYSLPWSVLTAAIISGDGPPEGALWCLGCESLRYAELAAIKEDLAPQATFIYETLPADERRFLNPLAYVFHARSRQDGSSRLIVLVQFKTSPMAGDNDHFEINGLQRGTRIYAFGGSTEQARLISLICSDALQFEDTHAREVHDRALVIHIQLNPNPRHSQFRQYRSKLFQFKNDSTELLCLNWARDVRMTFDGMTKSWNNIAGSAWYLRPREFDSSDPILVSNHQRGLYYTWCPSLRAHAMFLNFAPAVFHFIATKVVHLGVVGVQSRRIGPKLTELSTWNDDGAIWAAHTPDDHFSSLLSTCDETNTEVQALAASNPFSVERALALAAGTIGSHDRWHEVGELDSCTILESETIRRITFCQDTEPDAFQFRRDRMSRLRHLWLEILSCSTQLPPSLNDFHAGKRLEWVPDAPHQNVIANSGKRATVIYLGEGATQADAQQVKKRAAEYLWRSSRNEDHAVELKQRLAVWYRTETGSIELLDRTQYVKYDEPRTGSEFDIARTT